MTNRQQVDDWVARYVAAWQSNTADDIKSLFTEDAEYRYHPWDEPVVGHDAIVESWVAAADQPGDCTFEGSTIAVDGDRGIVEGRTVYLAGSTYRNLWVVELAEGGRARRFTEWFMTEPADIPTAA